MASLISNLKERLQSNQSEEEQFKDDFIYFWDDIDVDTYIDVEEKSLRETISENLVLFTHLLIILAVLPLIIIVSLNDLLFATIFGILFLSIVNLSYLFIKNRYVIPTDVLVDNVKQLSENNLTGNEQLLYAKEEFPMLAEFDIFRTSIVSLLRSIENNSEKVVKELSLTQAMNTSVYRAIDQINLTIENRLASVANYQETKGYIGQISNGIDNFTDNFDRTLSNVTEVNNILKSIGKQTTMLALNAGIEAAKAGKSGKGFEVVASNLRRLAQHAIDSSQRIGNEIETVNESAKSSIEEITIGMNLLNEVIDNNHGNISSLNSELFNTIRDLDDVSKQLAKLDNLVKFEVDELSKMKF